MSIVVYIRKYPRDLIYVTSGVASRDGTLKDVENDEFDYTPPAETVINPAPEVALPPFFYPSI